MKSPVLFSALMLIAFGCTSSHALDPYQDSPDIGTELKSITVGVRDIDVSAISSDTRTAMGVSNTVSFSWTLGDVLGIFPDKGAQVDFEVVEETGNSAKFDGGAWALKPSHKYSIYYPYSFENRDKTAIPFDFNGQVQMGKEDYSHLVPLQYLASGTIAPVDGICNFTLDRMSSVVLFQLTVPVTGTYDNFVLSVVDGTPIVMSITVDISGDNYVISPASTVPTFNLGLNHMQITGGEKVNLYAMIPPQDLTGKQLRISMTTTDGVVSDAFISGREFVNNHAYRYEKALSSDILGRGENAGNGGVWGN